MSLFTLRGTLKPTTRTILELGGFAMVLLLWFVLTMGETPIVTKGILPSPMSVFYAFGDLYQDNEIFMNVCRSLGLNLAGYMEAIAISIPLGFLIGLFPFFRGSLQRQVDAFRYVPLTAVTGLFIIWFGLGTGMKVHFLAFGILIYLLPIIVQRIDEVQDVYLKTVYTLGATNWQTIKSVYFPSVMSRLSDDIRVLTAISWTYIIVAEGLGNQGGIGSLIWRTGQRLGRIDKVFALLIIIIIIGIIQDRLFVKMDKEFFPFKYQSKDKYAKPKKPSSFMMIVGFILDIMIWIGLAIYAFLFINEFLQILMMKETPVLSYLFGDTVWVMHFIVFSILGYRIWKRVKK